MFQDELHHHYTDTARHWHSLSERHTGADSLLTLLKAGAWLIGSAAYCQRIPLSGGRAVTIFHVYVQHQGAIHHMRIIDTPYVHRLLKIYGIVICCLDTASTYPMAMRVLELGSRKIA
jgi:hypothetical protein